MFAFTQRDLNQRKKHPVAVYAGGAGSRDKFTERLGQSKRLEIRGGGAPSGERKAKPPQPGFSAFPLVLMTATYCVAEV